MVENLQAASAFGVARIDSLINELLLPDQKTERKSLKHFFHKEKSPYS